MLLLIERERVGEVKKKKYSVRRKKRLRAISSPNCLSTATLCSSVRSPCLMHVVQATEELMYVCPGIESNYLR